MTTVFRWNGILRYSCTISESTPKWRWSRWYVLSYPSWQDQPILTRDASRFLPVLPQLDSDISAYTYERTRAMEERREVRWRLKLRERELRRDPQTIVDHQEFPSSKKRSGAHEKRVRWGVWLGMGEAVAGGRG